MVELHEQLAKLNEGNVREIWRMLAMGVSINEISGRFGVGETAIRNIRDGRTWKEFAD